MTKDYIEYLDSARDGEISEARLSMLIQMTIPLIGHPVYIDGTLTLLDWHHFESYIGSKPESSDPLHDFLYAHISIALNNKIIEQNLDKNTAQFIFDNPQSALAFFHFMVHILPIKNHELPVLLMNEVNLSAEQFHFFKRTTMMSSALLPKEFVKDFFLKTLRADNFDFSSSFLVTLFNAEEDNRALQNLRPTNRGDYIIDSDGSVHERYAKKSSEQKRRSGFTQIQSTTLVDETLITEPFGFSRREALYGIMTHLDDLIISRLLVQDGGTITRPNEVNNLEEAHEKAISLVKSTNTRNQSLDQKLRVFKKENIKARRAADSGTNEVMARLRFNPYRCFVSICANTLSSRLLGHDFSEELLEHFTQYCDEKGLTTNPTFKIPIAMYAKDMIEDPFYFRTLSKKLRGNKAHDLMLYTREFYQADIFECEKILEDQYQRMGRYTRCEFEFLLGLNKLTLDIFNEKVEGVSLALYMMRKGYARMLLRLLRPARLEKRPLSDQNLLPNILNDLLDKRLIIENDPVIAEFIRIEAFEIADMLIDRTQSSKIDLPFGKARLIDHILERGNPRQMAFIGLEDALIKAAQMGRWVLVRLCLKEIKGIKQELLTQLLMLAVDQKKHAEIILLLQLGAGTDESVNVVIRIALSYIPNDLLIIELLLNFYSTPEKCSKFGHALLPALRRGKCSLARELFHVVERIDWRCLYIEYYNSESILFYVVKYHLNDLLEIAYKLETAFEEIHAESRLRLALDLAIVQENTIAIEFLQGKVRSDSAIDAQGSIKNVCILVFQAYFLGERELAEWRLNFYGRKFNVIPNDCNNIIAGLQYLLVGYPDALSLLSRVFFVEPFKCLSNLFLYYQNVDLYLSYRALTYPLSSESESTSTIYLVESLPLDDSAVVEKVKKIILHSSSLTEWVKALTKRALLVVSDGRSQNVRKVIYESMNRVNRRNLNAILDLVEYVLSLIENRECSIDSNYKNLNEHLTALFNIAYRYWHEGALHVILSNKKFYGIYNPLRYIITTYECFDNTHDHAEEEYIRGLIQKYSLTVSIRDIRLAIGNDRYKILMPLLEALDEAKFRSPANQWYLFDLVGYCIYNCIFDPEEKGFIYTATKIGPVRTRHYCLLFIINQIHRLLEYDNSDLSNMILSQNTKISEFFENHNVPFTARIYYYDPVYDHCLAVYKDVLALFNKYLSTLSDITSLPDEDVILETFQELINILESGNRGFPLTFLIRHYPDDNVKRICEILKKVDQTLNTVFADNNADQPLISPNPSDIHFVF